MVLSHDGLVSRIEAVPDQGEISLVVVQKSLVPEAGVIKVWLVEVILVSAGRTFESDDHRLL
jgi:hypothetical protein